MKLTLASEHALYLLNSHALQRQPDEPHVLAAHRYFAAQAQE